MIYIFIYSIYRSLSCCVRMWVCVHAFFYALTQTSLCNVNPLPWSSLRSCHTMSRHTAKLFASAETFCVQIQSKPPAVDHTIVHALIVISPSPNKGRKQERKQIDVLNGNLWAWKALNSTFCSIKAQIVVFRGFWSARLWQQICSWICDDMWP